MIRIFFKPYILYQIIKYVFQIFSRYKSKTIVFDKDNAYLSIFAFQSLMSLCTLLEPVFQEASSSQLSSQQCVSHATARRTGKGEKESLLNTKRNSKKARQKCLVIVQQRHWEATRRAFHPWVTFHYHVPMGVKITRTTETV